MWWKLYSAFVYPAPGWSPCHSYFSYLDHKFFLILLFPWGFLFVCLFLLRKNGGLNWISVSYMPVSLLLLGPVILSLTPHLPCLIAWTLTPCFVRALGLQKPANRATLFTNSCFVNWLIWKSWLLSKLLCGVLPACPSSLSDGREMSSSCGLLCPVLQVLTCVAGVSRSHLYVLSRSMCSAEKTFLYLCNIIYISMYYFYVHII